MASVGGETKEANERERWMECGTDIWIGTGHLTSEALEGRYKKGLQNTKYRTESQSFFIIDCLSPDKN